MLLKQSPTIILLLVPFVAFVAFSHVLWLGCLNENKIKTNRYVSPNGTASIEAPNVGQQLLRSSFQYVSSFLQAPLSPNLVDSNRKCPVPPGPLVSIFHLEWFHYAADIPQVGNSLYIALQAQPLLRDSLLRFAAFSTLLEWLFLGSLVAWVLWYWILCPMLRLVYLVFLVSLAFYVLAIALPFIGHVLLLPEDATRPLSTILYGMTSYIWASSATLLRILSDQVYQIIMAVPQQASAELMQVQSYSASSVWQSMFLWTKDEL